jgi:hypothetical protein
MRVSHILLLAWLVVFAAALPVLSWYSAETLTAKTQQELRLADLQRQRDQQVRAFQQREQDAQFVALVENFVSAAEQLGVSTRGMTQYPVRFRETIAPTSVAEELIRLRGEPERFYLPQFFFLGREGLSVSSSFNRQLESLPDYRAQRYVLSFQGRAMVFNDES